MARAAISSSGTKYSPSSNRRPDFSHGRHHAFFKNFFCSYFGINGFLNSSDNCFTITFQNSLINFFNYFFHLIVSL